MGSLLLTRDREVYKQLSSTKKNKKMVSNGEIDAIPSGAAVTINGHNTEIKDDEPIIKGKNKEMKEGKPVEDSNKNHINGVNGENESHNEENKMETDIGENKKKTSKENEDGNEWKK